MDDVPHGQSLWRLMRRAGASGQDDSPDSPSPPDAAAEPHGETPSVIQGDAPEPAGLKGLWSVMQEALVEDGSITETAPALPSDDSPPLIDDSLLPEATDEPAPPLPFPPVPSGSPVLERVARRPADRSRSGTLSLALGLAALPLAGLAVLPNVWAKFPATMAGFAALALGLMALGEARRSRGRQTAMVLPLAGMLLGATGMFLGPLVVARLAEGLRQETGRQQTIENLEAVGTALRGHHDAHGRFPAGSLTGPGPRGGQAALHGWMTPLLPYLGEQELHRSIDLTLPWHHEANFAAMSRDVPAFFAGGADRGKVGRGFGATHFSALGGGPGVGIFGGPLGMRREDITDGAANTLVAGEIAHLFPPWGEPENWRPIGRGLNRELRGFGNADGSGALFLKADGSVRFFSNQVSPEVLRRLSTPHGGEPIPEQFR